MNVEIHLTGDNCVIGAYGPLSVSIWRGSVNVVDLDAIASFSESVRAKNPGGYASLSIASILVRPPDSAAKKRIMELRTIPSDNGFKGSIVVLAGDGFWASAMRSLLAGLNLLGSSPTEKHVRTLAEAAAEAQRWFPSVDAADLERALAKAAADAGIKV